MLVAEKIRSLGEPQAKNPTAASPPAAPPSSAGGNENKRTPHDSSVGGMPPPETWTEAKFGDGGAVGNRGARVTGEGTVLPMIRIRPR